MGWQTNGNGDQAKAALSQPGLPRTAAAEGFYRVLVVLTKVRDYAQQTEHITAAVIPAQAGIQP